MPDSSPPLVVDLDQTLINEDIFFEMFANYMRTNPVKAFYLLIRYFFTPQKLKFYLAENTSLRIEDLSFNQSVISKLKQAKLDGRLTILATASIEPVAQQIANHLNLFDVVFASTREINLKSHAKAQKLVKSFGYENFDYIGDSKDDLEVWKKARKAIAVNCKADVERKLQSINKSVEILSLSETKWMDYILASRPTSWLKNTLVLTPLLFSHNLQLDSWFYGSLAFIIFSLLASSVYFFNDICDLTADRCHPVKSKRPIAAGKIPIKNALISSTALAATGLISALFVFGLSFAVLALCYLIITTVYSTHLKQLFILDTVTLVLLFAIRIFAGGIATEIEVSNMLLYVSSFGFFSLALLKRIAELAIVKRQNTEKPIGRNYHIKNTIPLTCLSGASTCLGFLFFFNYIQTDIAKSLYSAPEFLYAAIVMSSIAAFRIHYLAYTGGMEDDPVRFLFRDKFSQFSIILITIFFLMGTVY